MRIKNFFIILLGGISIVWIYNFFAGPESITYIVAHKEKLLLLVLAHIPTLFLDTLAWKILMRKNYLGLLWCFLITWISQTAGKITPTGAITGEFVRIYLSIKKGMTTSEASSTVIGDLALAAFSLLIMALVSFLFLFYNSENLNVFQGKVRYLTFSIVILIFATVGFCISIRKRFMKSFLRKFPRIIKLNKEIINNLIKFDFELFRLSFRLKIVFLALFYRTLGWIGGAFEIYVFFLIIGVSVDFTDVIIIESITGIIRAIVFFIPAGLGVQEISFVIVGNFLGLASPVSFSAAIGRRIREILVGVPALITWYKLFSNKKRIN